MNETQNPTSHFLHPISLRRSVLFVPGDSLHKISKAAQLEVDTIVMDLEDGVALNRKDEARRTVGEALRTLDFGRRERLIRLNPPPSLQEDDPAGVSALFSADIQAALDTRPDGYIIPKVETAAQVQAVSDTLAELEKTHGWPSDSLRLLVMIETARAVMNLPEIAQASQRLEALILGAEDLASDIGAKRTQAGWEVFYARSALVTAAAAYGLQAIDMIYADLTDLAGLEQECNFARQLGCAGKTAIHPRQLEVINRVFAPSSEEIEQAQRLLEVNAAHQSAGVGVFELDGKMVDRPMVRAAERILEKARLAGLLTDPG